MAAEEVEGAMQFASAGGVTIASRAVTFSKSIASPLTVSTTAPFLRSRPSPCSFSVRLPTKERKTAIGFIFNLPFATYMTPTYSSEKANYLSMGGAGFIYPKTRSAKRGYGEGDTVGVKVDWESNKVVFSVNGSVVGDETFSADVDAMYPSISSEGGLVIAEVDFA